MCCKTEVDHILSSYCFTGNRNSVFCIIHVFPNCVCNLDILHEIWTFIWSFDSQEFLKKFVATICQILRLNCTKFRYGSLQGSPDLLVGFKGPTSKGGEGNG